MPRSSLLYWRRYSCHPPLRIKVYLALYFREGNGNPLQYCCLENPMDRGAWWAAVHGVVKSRTRLSDFTFTFHFHAMKETATHSSVLAWRIPGMEEPGGLLSMGSHRVGHNWSDLAAAALYLALFLPKSNLFFCQPLICRETLFKIDKKVQATTAGTLTISLAAQGTHTQFGFWALPVGISNHHLADRQVIFVG